MAKRKRAPVRARKVTRARALPAAPASAKPSAAKPSTAKPSTDKPPSRNRYVFTPELLAYARRLYEETDTSLAKIAIDLGIHRSTVERIGAREGWVRFVPPLHGLPKAARLLAQAEALETATVDRHPEVLAALAPQGDGESQVVAAEDDGERQAADNPPAAETIERLYRAVLDELAAVEAMRAQLRRHPRGAVEAERTARTLSSLTETFQKLQRLQIATTPPGTHEDDDMPADIDAFRLDLARRIDAFVASRTEPGDAQADAVAAPVDEA